MYDWRIAQRKAFSTRRYRERLERVRVPLRGSKLRAASRRECLDSDS
ncbi:hypothetical protein [Nostoc sp. C052]|nr:hypothetical protein [Nostoc sp. C052]